MPRQRDRRFVRYRKLHRHDCRNAAPDQALGHAAKRVAARRGRTHATVQENQPQRGQVIPQQHRELASGNHIGHTRDCIRLQYQHTLIAGEIAMADKVQSVRPVFQQRIVEAFERCVLQPFNTNRTAGGEFVKRAVQMGNFLSDLQPGPVAGCRYRDQQPQWALGSQARQWFVHVEPPDHRFHPVGKQEVVLGRAIQELPGKPCELRRIGRINHKPYALAALRIDGAQAVGQPPSERRVEQCGIQCLAGLACVLGSRQQRIDVNTTGCAPRRPFDPPRVCPQRVFEARGVERPGIRVTRSRRRLGHGYRIPTCTAPTEPQLHRAIADTAGLCWRCIGRR